MEILGKINGQLIRCLIRVDRKHTRIGVRSDARLDDLSCEQIMEAAHATT